MEIPQRSLLETLLYYLGLYRIYITNYGKRLVEYRADTIVALFGGMAWQGGFLIFVNVIYSMVPQLNGFNKMELIFLFGFVTLGRELSRMFLDSPFRLSFIVRRGLLDTFLIRPCSTLFQVVAIDVQIIASGGAIIGLVAMITTLPHLVSNITLLMVVWLIVATICNMFVQFSILMILATLSFKIPEVSSVLLPVCWIYEFNRYPLSIFPGVIQGLLTFILPFAISAYYPVAYMLRPMEYNWVPIVLPLMTIVLFSITMLVWKWGKKYYSSSNA